MEASHTVVDPVPSSNRFLKWCSFSAIGHVVLFEIGIALPLLLVLSVLMGLTGNLTVTSFAALAVGLAAAGAVIGVLTWVAVTRPLIRRK